MRDFKLFTSGFFFIAVLSLAGLLCFNYSLDPNNRYQFHVSESNLRLLAEVPGHVLVVPGNYDDRVLLKKFIRVVPRPVTVIMGGSRIMNLQNPPGFSVPRVNFLNAGVTAGTIKDYIAIWQVMKQNKKLPRTLFLCVDPQVLNRVEQNDRWLSLSDDYQAFFKTSASGRYYVAALTSQLKDLLSLQTTRAAISRVGKKRVRPELLFSKDHTGLVPVRTASFALFYPSAYEEKDPSDVETLARANGEGETKAFRNWNRQDREYLGQFKMLIEDVKKTGVQVVLVLMPYHPLSLQTIKQDAAASGNLAFFREQLLKISRECAVAYYDGFVDTEKGLFSSLDFSDGVHLKKDPNQAFFDRVSQSLRFPPS
ncbi:MAG: hypothetical protein WC484_06600 [Candidatus Omnitrophota bacterium]